MNELAVALGLAVDIGEIEPVRVTLFIARGGMGAAADGQQMMGSTVGVVAREGANESEAIQAITRTLGRRISLHHVRAILLGEDFARRQIAGVEDMVARHPEIRLTARPFVVRGKAQRILELVPDLKPLQPDNLTSMLDATKAPRHEFKDFLVARVSTTHSGWMEAVRVVDRPAGQPGAPQQVAELDGSALFFGDRAVTFLTRADTEAMYWLLGDVRWSILSLPCGSAPEKSFVVRLMDGDSRIEPIMHNGQYAFRARLVGKVELLRWNCTGEAVFDPEVQTQIKQQVDSAVIRRVLAVTERFQAAHVDPVGFGKRVEFANPREWRTLRRTWPEVWPTSSVAVLADFKMQNSGLAIKPANRTELELESPAIPQR